MALFALDDFNELLIACITSVSVLSGILTLFSNVVPRTLSSPSVSVCVTIVCNGAGPKSFSVSSVSRCVVEAGNSLSSLTIQFKFSSHIVTFRLYS